MRWLAILAVLGCAGPTTHAIPDRSPAPLCPLSPRPAAPSPRAVAGYPLPIPRVLSSREREARLAELTATSPGWTWAIDPYGAPISAESEVVGLAADPLGDTQLAYARRLAAGLTPVGATLAFAVVGDRLVGTGAWRDGSAIAIGVERRLLLYAANRRAPASAATQAWRARVKDDGKLLVLDVEIPRPPPPPVPAGGRELAFAELDALWGHAYSTGTARVTTQPELQPCDPVGPHDCQVHQDQTPTSRCVPTSTVVAPLRKLVIAPDGLRYIVLVADGSSLELTAPRCLDAVTGEDLDGKADCGTANGGGYYIFYR